VNFESERALTGALVELTTGHPTKVCVTQGHGEPGLSEGLSGFAHAWDRENVRVETIATRNVSRISRDCHAVVIIWPRIAFAESEVEAVREYLRGGGNVLAALAPVVNEDASALVPLGLENMLEDFGVRADRSVVVEARPELLPERGGDPIANFYVIDWGEHAITQPFVGFEHPPPVRLGGARSIRPSDPERVHVLLRTSPQSFAVTDLRGMEEEQRTTAGPDDIRGPVPIAVATEVELAHSEPAERTGGRLVVLGMASIFSDEAMSSPEAVNNEFASAVVGWLTHRRALIAIAPRTYRERPVMISGEDIKDLAFRVIVLIPLAFLLLGLAVWWNRRQ
jgi:hypothetical protein